jgi:hypothetical protein
MEVLSVSVLAGGCWQFFFLSPKLGNLNTWLNACEFSVCVKVGSIVNGLPALCCSRFVRYGKTVPVLI